MADRVIYDSASHKMAQTPGLICETSQGWWKTVKDRLGFRLAPFVRQQPFERKRIFIKLMTLGRNLKASKEDSK